MQNLDIIFISIFKLAHKPFMFTCGAGPSQWKLPSLTCIVSTVTQHAAYSSTVICIVVLSWWEMKKKKKMCSFDVKNLTKGES